MKNFSLQDLHQAEIICKYKINEIVNEKLSVLDGCFDDLDQWRKTLKEVQDEIKLRLWP